MGSSKPTASSRMQRLLLRLAKPIVIAQPEHLVSNDPYIFAARPSASVRQPLAHDARARLARPRQRDQANAGGRARRGREGWGELAGDEGVARGACRCRGFGLRPVAVYQPPRASRR